LVALIEILADSSKQLQVLSNIAQANPSLRFTLEMAYPECVKMREEALLDDRLMLTLGDAVRFID
jgi:hypothetical protein